MTTPPCACPPGYEDGGCVFPPGTCGRKDAVTTNDGEGREHIPLHIRITHQTKALEQLFCLLCGAGTRERYECEHVECGPWLPAAEYDRRVALRKKGSVDAE